MEKEIVEIVKERLEENKGLFSKKEYSIIEENINIVKKIYLLGFINARNIYGNS